MEEKKLVDADIDYSDGLNRFAGNAALYQRFLKKFPEDTSYENLVGALDKQDYVSAFACAHTMKGTTGNLSMKALYRSLQPFVEVLRGLKEPENRSNFTDGEVLKELDTLFLVVQEEYQKVIKAIGEAFGG